ncbi:S1/P1 nuclease [Luteibacter anthropi]|uniref:S1/P1 nuclease n=1 Tax=Luteibacter anthropi TaxID=564369 RepID=A0A7X5ZK63_9GAMM|nr:S1/P1 nuclease [Luteibacter anthropi]NII08554.1 S1/P1 nuclease [Luteibacter anthropi]URX63063.1 S1/P1 nuclease [Luteibacter anthropi]
MKTLHKRRTIATLLALAVTAAAGTAQAWGDIGHRIVAELAWRQLDPSAKAEVERLLKADGSDSLADVASWPDKLRDMPGKEDLGKATGPLHYINFATGCRYQPQGDAGTERNVVGGLQKYVAILKDRSKSNAERAEALKFVVHFVGDVHQPLHAGNRDDKGGNDYQVQFQGKGTNLHRVWDSQMLYTTNLKWQAYADKLAAEGPVTLPKPIPPLDNPYAQWAEESCQIVAAPGFYPDGHTLDDAYVTKYLPVAETRLRDAGKRLADLLNKTLD